MHLYPPYFSMEVKYGALTVTEKKKRDPAELVQKKFLKWLLGINKYCTNNACRASTGRFPMKINAQCRNFKFWLSLINRDLHVALINRAGGLYGRILTEVASTDRTQWGLYQRPRSRFSHTDRPSSVNKMFIIWPNKKAKEQKHQ